LHTTSAIRSRERISAIRECSVGVSSSRFDSPITRRSWEITALLDIQPHGIRRLSLNRLIGIETKRRLPNRIAPLARRPARSGILTYNVVPPATNPSVGLSCNSPAGWVVERNFGQAVEISCLVSIFDHEESQQPCHPV
jgi:hypothetical protein